MNDERTAVTLRRRPEDTGRSRTADAALVARCRSGDESAARVLVERYAAAVQRLAGHFLDDPNAVADVVQETYAAAFAHLDRFDAERPFWRWLARIAVNHAIDHLRASRARPERPVETMDGQTASSPAADEAAVQAEERRRVRRVLSQLPPRYRTLLVLREMEGMSAVEIAAVLRRPAATIRWRLFKARQLFRDAWLAEERDKR